MDLKKYVLLSCLIGCTLITPLIPVQASTISPSISQAKATRIQQLLLQLQDLQEELKNLLKYKDHIPLNTVSSISGPRTVVAGTYNTWTILTQNGDPDNAGDPMIEWGDGMTAVTGTGHTYSTPGVYTMIVKNYDGNGQESALTAKITVTKNPQPGRLTAWGNKLVASESLIPKNQFREYFFNTRTFATTLPSKPVPNIYFAYPSEKTNDQYTSGLDHTVGAYWVGSFTYNKNTTLYFDFTNPQWDVARFIVDGSVLIDTGLSMPNDAARKITLKPGTHIIEIEYTINWHAGSFRAKMSTIDPAYIDIADATAAAKKIAGGSAVIVPLTQYSAENSETGIITAMIPNTTEPKILDLSTYESVLWDVRGASSKGVRAIIVSSYSGAADVINDEGIPVFHTRNYKD